MRKRGVADLMLLLVAFTWGVTFVVVQEAIKQLPPLAFNAVRFTIASFCLLIVILLFYRKQTGKISRNMMGSGIVLGIWLFGGYAFQTVGLQYTTSGKAGFITGLSVALVPLFAYFILREKPGWGAIFGAVSALFGLYTLTVGDMTNINIGDFYVLLCALCFGMQIVYTGKYAPHYPTLSLSFVQLSTVAVLSAALSPWIEPDGALAYDTSVLLQPSVFWALLITAIPATVLSFVAQTEFQKFTVPSHVALIFATEPVFAALADVWFLGTVMTIKTIVGCLFILAGMIIAELPMFSDKVRTRKTAKLSPHRLQERRKE